jgi:hypothetical protein
LGSENHILNSGNTIIEKFDEMQFRPSTKLTDGEEIIFGNGAGSSRVPLADPMTCNLRRVSHASGTSEVFDQFLDDEDEDACDVPIYFGGPFISDDVLMRRLEVSAC